MQTSTLDAARDRGTRYYVGRWSVREAGAGQLLLYAEGHGAIVVADGPSAHLLRQLEGARTLDAHLARLTALTPDAAPALREAIDALASAGFLQPVGAADAEEAPAPAPLETVGIITADRPECLARGLGDAIRQTSRYARAVRFLVVDGSRDPRNQDRTAQACRTTDPAASVVYVGPAERARLVSRLAALGFEAPAFSSGLLAGTAGANRNVLLLLTAGTPLLMVDDDVRWVTWRLPLGDDRVRFAGHSDLRRCEFFTTRAEALAAVSRGPADLLAEHERLLQRAAPSFIAGEADLTNACGHVLSALHRSAPAIVRLTQAGLAGDAGWGCPYQLLFRQDDTGLALRRDGDRLARALSSREVYQAGLWPIVTHDAQVMGYCMGLANDDLMPPFLPIGRNEDGAFGAMLGAVDRRALFGHLSCGIVHDSVRPSARTIGPIASATATRFADVVVALVRSAAAAPPPQSVGSAMRRMASTLSGYADLSIEDFRDALTQLVLDLRGRELATLESILETDPSCDPLWRNEAQRYHDQILARIADPRFVCPVEFDARASLEAGLRDARQSLHEFSELVAAWPEVWRRSTASREDLMAP